MNKLLISSIFVLFVMNSCSLLFDTGPTFQQRVLFYVGKDEQIVINDNGLPHKTYESDGLKYLEYSYNSTGSRITTNEYLRNNPYTCNDYYCPPPSAKVRNYNNWCSVLFTVSSQNKVINASFRGNSCPR